MNEPEFDKFADGYKEFHQEVLGVTGETIEYFSEYKVRDTKQYVGENSFPSDLSILDFGSGIGGSVPYFLSYFPNGKLTCLDVSYTSLLKGKQRYPEEDTNYIHFDGNQFPFGNDVFHVVFSACVFHHIDDSYHEIIIKEIWRILKPKGVFIVFEHNPLNYFTVQAVNACKLDENAVLIRGEKFKKLLHRQGFPLAKLSYRIFFPNSLKFLRPLERYMQWIPFGAQYTIRAPKAER